MSYCLCCCFGFCAAFPVLKRHLLLLKQGCFDLKLRLQRFDFRLKARNNVVSAVDLSCGLGHAPFELPYLLFVHVRRFVGVDLILTRGLKECHTLGSELLFVKHLLLKHSDADLCLLQLLLMVKLQPASHQYTHCDRVARG